MVDYITLAMTYGGFTGLDQAYLTTVLTTLSEKDKLTFITPPPSVINAYFAETYDKQGPKAATDYFFSVTSAFNLFQNQPSFIENKPFIRLNLSGKAYGFCYREGQEMAHVFSEKTEPVTEQLLFELAQLFPHYQVYEEQGMILMVPLSVEGDILESVELPHQAPLLADAYRLSSGVIRLSSFNQEEVLELSTHFPNKKRYYHYYQREFRLFLVPDY